MRMVSSPAMVNMDKAKRMPMMVNLAHFGWTSLANQRPMMMKTSVPRVPIGTSRSAVGEVKLAKKTPSVTAQT